MVVGVVKYDYYFVNLSFWLLVGFIVVFIFVVGVIGYMYMSIGVNGELIGGFGFGFFII